MTKIFYFIVYTFFMVNACAEKLHSPIDILDSAIYYKAKNLDNLHIFLGCAIPKHLYIMLSEKDKDLTLKTLVEALETSPSFVEHKWNNLSNQHRGIVTVMPAETINDYKCRNFNVRFLINDESYDIQGRSCRVNKVWNGLETSR